MVPQNPVGHSFVQSWSGKALKRDLILNFRKPKGQHVLQMNAVSKESLDVEQIILESARNSLLKMECLPLSEIYEVAVMRWIDMVYGGLKYDESHYDENLGFDVETVDGILQEKSGFTRTEQNNRIYYRWSK